MAQIVKREPLVSAGLFLGAGLGGFVDGIVLHQILQWHNMLSGKIAPDTLVNVKVNMVWDGLFHAGVWLLTLAGIYRLYHAGKRADSAWSGRLLLGAMLQGWGLFNLIEGIIDHQLLGLHHVVEFAPNHLPGDLLFLALGVVLFAAGRVLTRSVVNAPAPGSAT